MNIVQYKLDDLHNDAKRDYMRVGKGVVKSMFRPLQPQDLEHAYLPISQEQGKSLQRLILNNNCKNIVEFGTSFGISTIYLAEAAQQTGGKVTTTELIESKAKRAQGNLNEIGLSNEVTVLIRDAMETLRPYSQPIDFLFLDGWKDLYLPLFQMLEPLFHSDTIIYADNVDMAGTQDYMNYLTQKSRVYSTHYTDRNKASITTLKNQ